MKGRGKKTEQSIQKRECAKCNKSKNLKKEFYIADELLYSDGRFSICKTCIEKIVNDNGFNGFIVILRAMNRPFIHDIWNDDHRYYIRQISSLPQYKGLTFEDSIFKGELKNKTSDKINEIEDEGDIIITPAMRRFWRGYDDVEIKILEDYFQELTAVYECETPIQRSIYRNMAITQYMADNAKTATEFDKLMSTLSKLMQDANVKPVQESGVNDSGLSTWGEWIKKIEETEPIPEPTKEFKDVDNIKKYIDKWFVRHFAKIFGIADVNETDGEVKTPNMSGEENEK